MCVCQQRLVEDFERRVKRVLGKWLVLPQNLNGIAMYSQSDKLKLPISSLNEEFKVSRAREVQQRRQAALPDGIEVSTRQK